MIIPKLNFDSTDKDAPNNTLRWAKNVVITNDGLTIKNEDGFEEIINLDKLPIGIIPFHEGLVVFSVNDSTNMSEIGVYRNDVYTPIIISTYLKFHSDCPIEGVYKYNNKRELVVSWWDGINSNSNSPYILNVDNLPFNLDSNLELINASNIELIKMFPEFKIPKIDITSEEIGGHIPVGLYSFMIAYNIDYVNYTRWTGHTRYIPIDNPGTPSTIEFLNANPFKSNSNKRVTLQIENLDTSFKSFRLGTIARYDDSESFIEIGTFEINGNIKTVIFDGQSVPTNVSVAEASGEPLIFDKVKTGTINYRKLVLGNVVTKDFINLQPYANEIQVSWVTEWITNNFYKNGLTTFYSKGFMPGEVYAFYIYGTLKGGGVTEAFHIPGRVSKDILINPSGSPSHLISEKHLVETCGWMTSKVNSDERIYHIFETAEQTGTDAFSCPYGTMGYWENLDEVYPNTPDFDGSIFGSNIAGQNVRHHKFPCISTVHKSASGITKYVLGVTFSNINIPNDIRDKLESIHFGFARRTVNNRTIIGNSVLYPSDWYNDPPHTSDYYMTFDFKQLSELDNTFVDHVYLEGYANDKVFYPRMTFSSYKGDIENQGEFASNIECVITNSFNDIGSVEHTDHLRLHVSICSFGMNLDYRYSPYTTITYPYASLRSFKRNVFYEFNSQEIVPLGYTFLIDDLGTNPVTLDYYNYNIGSIHRRIFGGDTYLGIQRIYLERDDSPYFYYSKISPSIYSQYLLEERQALNTGFPASPTSGEPYNLFKYDVDWIALNKYIETFPYNTNTYRTNSFPYSIYRSIPESTDGLVENWRTFLYTDTYKLKQEKGELWALNSINNTLLINQKYSMFAAYVKDTLKSNNTDMYLAQGDIFDREPEELLGGANGYIGCESQFGITVFPYGVLVPDRKQGKIFMYDGKQVHEISAIGGKEYFKNNLNTLIDIDNPFARVGIISAFDDQYNRFIIAKSDFKLVSPLSYQGIYDPNITYNINDVVYLNNVLCVYVSTINGEGFRPLTESEYIDTSKTWSFSVKQNAWTSLHDYHPTYLCYNRNGVYAIRKNIGMFGDFIICKINNPLVKGKYFDNTIHQSYIDVIFNDEYLTTKFIENVEWNTELINNGIRLFDETINHLMVYNDTQCTGILDVNVNKDWYNSESGRSIFNTWYYNNIFDAVLNNKLPILDEDKQVILSNVNKNLKNFFKHYEFICKFAILRMIYDNSIINGKQSDIYFHDAKINFINNVIQ